MLGNVLDRSADTSCSLRVTRSMTARSTSGPVKSSARASSQVLGGGQGLRGEHNRVPRPKAGRAVGPAGISGTVTSSGKFAGQSCRGSPTNVRGPRRSVLICALGVARAAPRGPIGSRDYRRTVTLCNWPPMPDWRLRVPIRGPARRSPAPVGSWPCAAARVVQADHKALRGGEWSFEVEKSCHRSCHISRRIAVTAGHSRSVDPPHGRGSESAKPQVIRP